MERYEHLRSSLKDEESIENSGQNNGPKWRVYLGAAVRRQQQLASLNERLARLLRFARDVEFGGPIRRENQSSHAAKEDSLPRNRESPCDGLACGTGGTQSVDSFCQNSFEIEELGAAIEEKTQRFRSSLALYDIRIDTLRRAMNSLNEKNEELMQKNAELRFSSGESNFELQQLRAENEKLRTRLNDQAVSRPTDECSQQNLINSLQQENRRLKSRLARHKQTLRNGLDDFISRSMEALQNGTPMQTSYEKILGHDSGDEREQQEIGSEHYRSSVWRDSSAREQVAQLREHLQSVTDELEHEKFRSQRKINVMQEASGRLREHLTRKENELHETNEELEAALGALQSLIQTGDETQRELAIYRRLLDREESRMYDRSHDADGSLTSSAASGIPFRSREGSEDAGPASSPASQSTGKNDFATESSRSLEIGKHDVRNGKFVVLENKGDDPLDISRWYLVQKCGENKVTHRFPSPFIIKPRSKVIIWSADVKTSHQSPTNYVMAKTVFPWCESGEVELITKVYDRLGYQISKRETRIHLRNPVAPATQRVPQDSRSFVHQLEAQTCCVS